MDQLTIVKKVRELVADPARWARGAYVRDQDFKPVGLQSADETCSFCINGAWAYVSNENRLIGNHPLDRVLADCVPARWNNRDGTVDSAGFNDDATHEEVLAALDCAIAKMEAGNA